MSRVQELRDRRVALATKQRDILERQHADGNPDLTAEEITEFDGIEDELRDVETSLERELAVEARTREILTPQREGIRPGQGDSNDADERAAAYATAFDAWMRMGGAGLGEEERKVLAQGAATGPEFRDLGIGTGNLGGYLVPQGFYDRIIRAQKAFGGMRQASFVFQTDSGQPLPVPQDNDTGQTGELLTEGSGATVDSSTPFGQKILNAYMYSSKIVKASLQLLQDSAFPIETYLAGKLGIRLGRIQNTHFTTGTGTGQPQGVVTGATLGKTGLTGQTTSIIYDDLVDLEHSVDPAYRLGAQLQGSQDLDLAPKTRWMFHDSTLKALKKLKDSQQRPLWVPGLGFWGQLAEGEPDTILGYPYVINQDVAVMAANAKSVLFGDFSNYFIREVTGVVVLQLRERYADALQVGFLAFQRVDGALMDAGTAPIKWYANSAT